MSPSTPNTSENWAFIAHNLRMRGEDGRQRAMLVVINPEQRATSSTTYSLRRLTTKSNSRVYQQPAIRTIAQTCGMVPLRDPRAAEDRNAAVASGIGGPQSTADFGDEIGRKRQCL